MELYYLFRLTYTNLITIDIIDTGTLDGSNLATQIVLRDIASII